MTASLLTIRDLQVSYRARGQTIPAVRGIDLDVAPGEIVALVGESGSGKSTVARAILGMLADNATIGGGSIRFDGIETTTLDEAGLRRLRGQAIGWVPQDPMVTLNPLHRVGRHVTEPLVIHRRAPRRALRARAIELLAKVGLSRPALRARQFPHELSGGMRQRVLIAGALAAGPRLIIADEPTTALDVTVQQRILDDIQALAASSQAAVLIITHDLAVAADRADRVVVLRDGRVVEQGRAAEVLGRPRDAYTRLLIASAPSLGAGRKRHGAATIHTGTPIVEVSGLGRDFAGVRAVEDVAFSIAPGETLGLVGESGSGKSTVARMVLGLTAPTRGAVRFDGRDIGGLDGAERRLFRQQAQMVYQGAYASLNPRMTIAEIVAEPLRGFGIGTSAERRPRALRLLEDVGLDRRFADRFPAELSGGQRQRVAIARALASRPRLIVCDEPVSALDVSVQAQILDLFADLQARYGLAYLFISHDLAVIRQVADQVGVMKDGRLVEAGPAADVFLRPQHDYTRLLLDAIPGRRARAPAAPVEVVAYA
ncbi:MAG: dipeptide ABC transporter ATP-binding protein [Ferrovibrionaceae bacterium]